MPRHLFLTSYLFVTIAYRLCEDIVFCPGKPDLDTATNNEDIVTAFSPSSTGLEEYNKKEFALGFFAALSIQADGVDLSLNGYSIKQCKEHALMQRFFALIELASSPFLPAVGPHDFVTTDFVSAKNFQLKVQKQPPSSILRFYLLNIYILLLHSKQ